MNKHGAIGVRAYDSDEVTICASADPGAGYHTLCGNSLNDSEFVEAPIADKARINCVGCKHVWNAARAFKATDFTIGNQ